MKKNFIVVVSQIIIFTVALLLSPQTLMAQKKNKKNKAPAVTCHEYNYYSPAPLENLLLKYCSEGDTTKMTNLISKGVNLNFTVGSPRVDSPSDIHFPLKNAIESYNLDAVRLLLQKGADVQHCAYELDFFDRRKDFNYPTIDFVKVLGLTDNQAQSVFQKKLEYLKQVIGLLREKGFQIKDSFSEYFLYDMLNDAKNQDALNLYDYLVESGMTTNLTRFLKSSYFSGVIRPSDTLFYSGILKRGADINFFVDREVQGDVEQTFYYDPPLISAIKAKNIFTINFLIKKGSNVNFNNPRHHNEDQCSPLINAIKTKNIEIVKLLIDSGANINSSCHNGFRCKSPLGFAMSVGANDIVDYLVEKGAK